jgi:flavin-dependent dehydrogenase
MSPHPTVATDIAIVGGGPSGAAVAARLAASGREVLVLERRASPTWRACGVYTSPMTRHALQELGVRPVEIARLSRPIGELRVETMSGASCRLGHEVAGPATGVDRPALERTLLAHARAAGALVQESSTVRRITPGGVDANLEVSGPEGPFVVRARVVVGADGPRSLVCRSFAAEARGLPLRRAGLTLQRHDPAAAPVGVPMAARLVFGRGWYLGVTPVPRGRVNLGLVVTPDRLGRDPATLIEEAIRRLPPGLGDGWREAAVTDGVRVAYPLAHRVARYAGPGFLLVGDAAGFIDPVTGEGLHRAFRSAELAAAAVLELASGRRDAFTRYDARLRSEYRRKDAISWLFQLFMARPELLDYAVRRLERRDRVRTVFGMVMSDLLPAARALDPRFVAAFLCP